MGALKFMVGSAALVLAAYVALGAVLYLMQRSQQYFPSGSIDLPAALKARGATSVTLTAADGVRTAAWFAAPAPGKPTLLYLPGNGGSIADSTDRFVRLTNEGVGFLALSYRGYPGSEGSPSEAGLVADALAAFDWLADRAGTDRIVIYGWSLGSGVAVQVAHRRGAAALVLESPFLSAEAIAWARYPIYPIGLLMKDTYRSDLLLGEIGEPLVVAHGSADRVIPVGHGRALAAIHSGPKTYIEIEGGGHVDLWQREGWRRIRQALVDLGVEFRPQ